MDIKRLSIFDWVAAGAGLVTLITLWLPWIGAYGATADAWQYRGGIDVLILLLSLATIVVALSRAVLALPFKVPGALILMGIGIAVVVLVVYSMIDQGPFGKLFSLQWGIFASLAGGVVIAGAGFLKLSEGPAPQFAGAAVAPGYPAAQYPPQGAAPQGYAQQAPYAPQGYAQPPQQYADPADQAYAAPPAQPVYPAQQYAPPVAPQPPAAPQPPVATDAAAAPAAVTGFCTACGSAFPSAEAQFCTSCGAQRGA